jgi:hypothetical protein
MVKQGAELNSASPSFPGLELIIKPHFYLRQCGEKVNLKAHYFLVKISPKILNSISLIQDSLN